MRTNFTRLVHGALFIAAAFLTACNGGGGGDTPAPTTYTIGGTVSGLTGTGLVLQNNGGGNLAISANGSFVFATPLASGAAYSVTVKTQPTGQTCAVNAGAGTVGSANITNVAVVCSANAYTIGGTVTGLAGTGLVLQNNGGDNLAISANGTFVFATPQANFSAYFVTVLSNPAGQTCSVASGVGAVNSANVTTVAVTCSANTYSIGGTITGLTGSGLVLQNNGGDNLSVGAGAASFTFNTQIAHGAGYSVTVLTQPTGQTCTVTSGSGTVNAANVTSVALACSVNTYMIGGTVTGLTGTGLVLQNNGGDDRTITSAGAFTFATQLAYASTYSVTILTQPTSQICTVTNASGTVTAAVTNVSVSCVNTYTIGGTITGAAAGIGPILQNNGGDNLFISAISTTPVNFTFSTPIANGANYLVTQISRGRVPSQDCSGSIVNGSGVVSGANVTNVTITCVLSPIIPKFAYVTNSTANTAPLAADTVSAFTVDAAGNLAAASPATAATGDQPYSVAVDPTGQFAYVVNQGSDSVSVYSIDRVGGALTLVDADGSTGGTQPSIATGDSPISVAVHPSGKFAYVANQGNGSTTGNSISAYSVNTTSGALTLVDADGATAGTQTSIATGLYPYAITIDPLGRFAYVANYNGNNLSAYTIDQTTGALTALAAAAAGTGPSSIAVDPLGKCALVTNNTSDNVMSYQINQTTGALTLVTTAAGAASSNPRSVAIDPNTGLYAYVANALAGSVSAFGITLSTCAIAAVNADAVTPALTIAAGTVPISANVDPSGQFVYVANFGSNNVSVYSIGIGGALTPVQTMATGAGPTSVTTTP